MPITCLSDNLRGASFSALRNTCAAVLNDCRADYIPFPLVSISVGYHNNTTAAKQGSFGPVFKQVGTNGATYKLGDFTAKGMDDTGADYIQFLDTANAATYLSAVYVDPTAYGEEYGGWWDFNDMFVTPLNEQEFAAGTAFLCLFKSGNTVTFECAGEVEHGRTISTEDIENPGVGVKQPFICNPLPVNLTLGQITALGMDDTGADYIQFLEDQNASTVISAVYVDPSAYGEDYGGWWDFNDMFVTPLNDTPVNAGAAFLGLFKSGNVITFQFPDPLAAKDVE